MGRYAVLIFPLVLFNVLSTLSYDFVKKVLPRNLPTKPIKYANIADIILVSAYHEIIIKHILEEHRNQERDYILLFQFLLKLLLIMLLFVQRSLNY